MILPLKVLQENGYIRLVDSSGDWIAVMTGKPDDEGRRRQLRNAEELAQAYQIVDLKTSDSPRHSTP